MEEQRCYSIKLLGDKQNKVDGFGIMMHSSGFSSFKEDGPDVYHGVNKKAVELLKKGEIKFEVL